jgi:hypothetical protein
VNLYYQNWKKDSRRHGKTGDSSTYVFAMGDGVSVG